MLIKVGVYLFSSRSSAACAKKACRPEDFIGAAQLFDFALGRLDAVLLRLWGARPRATLYLLKLHPLQQGVA